MKKGQNRTLTSKADDSLPRGKILRGKGNFQRLFEASSVLHASSLTFIYRMYSDSSKGIQIGFSTPKKTFRKAVARNQMKRKMREAYRIRQHILKEAVSVGGGALHGLLVLKKEASFSELRAEMELLLKKTAKIIIKKSGSETPPSQKTESLESQKR